MVEPVRLGVPDGSLQEATVELLAGAGWKLGVRKRSYYPSIDDPEIEPVFVRPQEMSRYVEAGKLDAGIMGRDWVIENESDVVEVASLAYSKQSARPVRWVLAVPENSGVRDPRDLEGKRVATELVRVTRRFFEERKVNVEVEFSWGATEGKVPGFVDAIVDLTETGASLRAHGLRVVETVLESVTVLVASNSAWADREKRRKIEAMAVLLRGAVMGRDRVGIKMNVPEEKLEGVLALLPALRRPTVSPLSQKGWCAIETVMEESTVRSIIPALKGAGAEGIIEYPLNKVIP